MDILREEKQQLNEIATICGKNDGYGMIIEVYSEDHGVIGSSSDPAHAHLKTTDNKYLGKFVITKYPPHAARYVLDCDKNKYIPPEYKKTIVRWSKMKYDKMKFLNWIALKLAWDILHPYNVLK